MLIERHTSVNIPYISPLQAIIMRLLLLCYGGVALVQWLHLSLSGGGDALDNSTGLDPASWLRDGTLAIPFVAAVVFLAYRRPQGATLRMVVFYSVVMGAGFLLSANPGAGGAHASHEGAEVAFSSSTLLVHLVAIATASILFALLVDMVITSFAGNSNIEQPPTAIQNPPQSAPLSGRRITRSLGIMLPLVAVIVAVPSFLTGSKRVAAQAIFPDQVIHPKGNLLLIARSQSDGSMAFVAPDFGPNGVRPTIEMTEGETLNITVKNELSADVSLHVHGVLYNQDSDGTRHSNSFVRPGQQRVYQWRAAAGTSGYWHYHDHVMGDDEGTIGVLNGLYGGLVVRKPGDPKPVKTFIIVGNDKTINGSVYPNTPTYVARQGELVEWLVVSHGNRVHTFHLHGHRWLNPYRPTDPNPALPANVGSGYEDNRILAPGQSFGFITIAGEGVGPGMWMYHCHFQDHAAAMKGFFNVLPASGQPSGTAVVPTSRTFPETGKTVSGRFLEYWNANGGLAQQGFPLSEPFMEKSDTDGKTYQVQYFERSVFEAHPENKPPYDVLLSQLGTFRYKEKYPDGK